MLKKVSGDDDATASTEWVKENLQVNFAAFKALALQFATDSYA